MEQTDHYERISEINIAELPDYDIMCEIISLYKQKDIDMIHTTVRYPLWIKKQHTMNGVQSMGNEQSVSYYESIW